ncbi:MAG: thiamine phosphate synthase [Lysobacteraceae bacterium]|nr:MAG: thiamine phosphate synthase [Xanthomonadaceae bacterium]
MARCYSVWMHKRQTRPQYLPAIWLLSDARNDAVLETLLRQSRQRIGFVFRHYHLAPDARRARYRQLKQIADRRGHLTILSGSAAMAERWRAHGYYAPARRLTPKRTSLLAIATAHDIAEIAAANRAGADAVMLSPVFATRSHPGARGLGGLRFLLLARHAAMPVIALGGMNPERARRLRWPQWAAIDGLSLTPT